MRGALPCSLLFAGTAALADVINIAGMEAYESCGYCHGIDGNSGGTGLPHLGGQDRAYLRKQLADFRAGRRGDDASPMRVATEGLDEAALDTVAAYFSRQSPPGSAAMPELFVSGRPGVPACAGCHEGEGHSRLAGQDALYLRRQLLAFRDGTRRNDGGVMQAIARNLTPDEIDRLSTQLEGAL